MVSHPLDLCTVLLAERWRDDAAVLRRRGQATTAEMVESMADELTTWVTDWLDTCVTLREAADMGGYAYSTLEHRVRVGELPNAGEKGCPRLRRRDVPIKAGSPARLFTALEVDADDLDQLLATLDK